MGIREFFAVALLSASVFSANALAQPEGEPGQRAQWKFSADPLTRKHYAAANRELGAFETELRALDTLIRRTPAVAMPAGFSAQAHAHLDDYQLIAPGQPKGAELPLGGVLTLGALPVSGSRSNVEAAPADAGGAPLIDFIVNDIQPDVLGGHQRPDDWREIDTDVFLQPPEAGLVAGFPRFGNYVVIKKRPDPLWTPVSLEEALRLVIAAERSRLAPPRDSRTPEVEVRTVERKIAGIEAHIAALRPEDRRAASCWTGRGSQWGQRFQPGSAPDCRPLVRPNWAYFDRALPRSAPQLLLITGIDRCHEGEPAHRPGGCAIQRQLLDSLDRQALLDWLH